MEYMAPLLIAYFVIAGIVTVVASFLLGWGILEVDEPSDYDVILPFLLGACWIFLLIFQLIYWVIYIPLVRCPYLYGQRKAEESRREEEA